MELPPPTPSMERSLSLRSACRLLCCGLLLFTPLTMPDPPEAAFLAATIAANLSGVRSVGLDDLDAVRGAEGTLCIPCAPGAVD